MTPSIRCAAGSMASYAAALGPFTSFSASASTRSTSAYRRMIGLFEFWLLVRAVRSTYFIVKICGDTSTKRPLPKSYLDHPTVSQALSPIQAQPTCFAVAIWVLMLSGTEPSYQVAVPGSDTEPDRFHAANTA